MRFESTAKVLAEGKLKYYRISECTVHMAIICLGQTPASCQTLALQVGMCCGQSDALLRHFLSFRDSWQARSADQALLRKDLRRSLPVQLREPVCSVSRQCWFSELALQTRRILNAAGCWRL